MTEKLANISLQNTETLNNDDLSAEKDYGKPFNIIDLSQSIESIETRYEAEYEANFVNDLMGDMTNCMPWLSWRTVWPTWRYALSI